MKSIIFGMVHTKPSAHYTPYAVDSFLKHTNGVLFLIDNDQSLNDNSNINYSNPKLKVIKRHTPFSFSQNANELMRAALESKSDLFFLNNDIIFTKNWLTPFIENFTSIQIPSSNNQYQYEGPNLKLEFSMTLESYLGKESELAQISNLHIQQNYGLIQRHSAPYYAVHIPYMVLKTVGLFDERYFPYGWEDTDYTTRAYLEGIPIFVNSNSYVLHFYGKSTWNKDGHGITEGDKHCAKLYIDKWGNELADLFGYQKPESLLQLNDIRKEDLTDFLKKKVLNSRI